ncbi:MAG TPA: hypothetical protein VHC90_08165 [Bryobacteraceae bacterium]|nr:hypothetical protein [Bryobacteraceae bacterium]
MLTDLLLAASKQAEQSEPAVRAAALMHIARVMALSDPAAAIKMLEQGIALAETIERDEPSLLLRNAVALAAAVSAQQALPLYEKYGKVGSLPRSVIVLVNNLAQHGHVADAVAYLRNPLPGDRFPLHFVNNLERECRDDETRRALLELAIDEWKKPAAREPGPEQRFAVTSFAGLFSGLWNLLPREAAAPVARELAGAALRMQPERREYPLTENPDDPRLASDQELELFRLIPALQDLAPDLARSILEAHPGLAAAINRFPLGMRSVWDGQSRYEPARDDVVLIGDEELMPIADALATGFAEAFRRALETLANDANSESPNAAHKECWPSAREFRHILFKAGSHEGMAAAKHLSRIPDPDLRLFARIELCAGIAGLPELGGLTTQFHERRRHRTLSAAEIEEMFGSILPGIRCPKCAWTPRAGHIWICRCGHHWNTFTTLGLCPECRYQWEITACPQCGKESPHQEWYEDRGRGAH